jgi:hypothetical protein
MSLFTYLIFDFLPKSSLDPDVASSAVLLLMISSLFLWSSGLNCKIRHFFTFQNIFTLLVCEQRILLERAIRFRRFRSVEKEKFTATF